MKFYILFYFLFLSLHFGFSQTHIYEHFGVDEGLPSSEVYDIYQDKQGYVWFATDKGLSRYNGYEFENFTTKDGLPDNTILDFYPQKNGQVWCYGFQSQSLFYFNEIFDGFKTYEHNSILKTQLKTRSVIKSVVLDEQRELYIGGHYITGLVRITDEGELKIQYDLSTNIINPKATGGNTSLGIETTKGVFFNVHDDNYESKENVFFFMPYDSPTSRVDIVMLNDKESVFIDRKLGVVSRNGKIRYYETEQYPIGIKRINDSLFFAGYYNNGAEIRSVSGQVIQKFLPEKSVTDFLIDAEGSYWFTTLNDGVHYIKNPNIHFFMEEHISSLVKDENNTLFAGYNEGSITRISKNTIEVLYRGLKNNSAIVEFDTLNNHLYGYSDGKYINYTTKENIPISLFIKNLPENIEGQILTSHNDAITIIENDSISQYDLDFNVKDVCSYKEAILIGTSSGLLIQENNIIKSHHQSLDILKNRIDDIDFNKKTNMAYIATQGAGMVVYGDSIYSINVNNGLTNNIVSEVHIENDSTVWACTNTGLNRIIFENNNRFTVSTITKNDGLLSNDIDDIEIINDTVWVATKKGLCYFNKSILKEKSDSEIISLSLNEVTVNSKRIINRNIKLKHNENNIDFKLQAISHKNRDHINYFYRLKEVDTTWKSTTNRLISFPSIPPGNYTFEAQSNVHGNKNDLNVLYNFKILPPYWKSWWFFGICFLLLSGLVYLFFRIRVLSYNKDVFRELIRLAIKRLKRKEQFYKFRSNGEDFKIPTRDILYINSQGNYLDIVTKRKTYTIRCKIGNFVSSTPDALEYLRVHRSYIIRIDQVYSKGKNWVVIKDNKIPVGETYLSELDKIHF